MRSWTLSERAGCYSSGTHTFAVSEASRKETPGCQNDSIQLFSCFTGWGWGGGGCGLHFPSLFTSKYEAEGIIPNPEGRPHPSRSIRFPRFQKKSLHLTRQTGYLTLTCLPVWSSADSKTQGGIPASLQAQPQGRPYIQLNKVVFNQSRTGWHVMGEDELSKGSLCSFEVLFISFILCMHAKLLQLCPTLRDPMDCSLPESSARGILQARILGWAAIPSPGIRLPCLMSPALAGGFFATGASDPLATSAVTLTCESLLGGGVTYLWQLLSSKENWHSLIL